MLTPSETIKTEYSFKLLLELLVARIFLASAHHCTTHERPGVSDSDCTDKVQSLVSANHFGALRRLSTCEYSTDNSHATPADLRILLANKRHRYWRDPRVGEALCGGRDGPLDAMEIGE